MSALVLRKRRKLFIGIKFIEDVKEKYLTNLLLWCKITKMSRKTP